METLNAIQYLKQNGFADNKSYNWINPILKKLLDNELKNEDIDDLISSIVKREKKISTSESEEAIAVSVENNYTNLFEISQIKEICEVSNFGLLDVKEAIKLNKNLNIFYGLNGVGKSSLYKAICSALNINKDRKCVPNIDGNDSKMVSKVKVIDKENNERVIEFPRDSNEVTTNVRVFDSYISNYIINTDQDNEFEVPYLKQEYFYVIRDLLDNISDRFNSESHSINERVKEIKEFFKGNLDFLNKDYKTINENIKKAKFDDDDAKILEGLKREKILLESDTSKIILKSYEDRINEVDKILKKFCIIRITDGKFQYSLKFGEQFLHDIKNKCEEYTKAKLLFEANKIENLGENIPNNWLQKEQWIKFIEAGLTFVSSLEDIDKQTYSENKCPYCQQDLNDKSKELLKSYNNLRNTYKENMDKYKADIDAKKTEIAELLTYIDQLESINIKIDEELKDAGINQGLNINVMALKNFFEQIKGALVKHEGFDAINFNYYSVVVNRYIDIRESFSIKIAKLKEDINEKGVKISEINNQINGLNKNEIIIKNDLLLKELVAKLMLLEDIESKKNSLTPLKSSLSKLENNFSKESVMKLFKEKLFQEYKELQLIPPNKLDIRPQKNKRICRIGDYKVSDIYSEGELKIHSLAEFFAKCEVDRFRGVYIFDDPVNSLDYERMEYVKKRIHKLVDEGNQVLVFTHNIYFLNSLVNTEKEKVNEIRKLKNQICVLNETILGDKNKSIKELKERIDKKMKELSKRNISEIDEIELSSVYDLMSGCLENYVENKLLGGLISRYRPNIRMYSLTDLKSIDGNLVDKIYDLYNNTSRYGNRHDSPMEALSPSYDNLLAHYEIFKEIVS